MRAKEELDAAKANLMAARKEFGASSEELLQSVLESGLSGKIRPSVAKKLIDWIGKMYGIGR